MFMMKSCPHCKKALQWMEELKAENSKFNSVEVKIIDETLRPDIANQFDYYYVPAYYIDSLKVHEGVATKDIVRSVFERAIEDALLPSLPSKL